jgi:nitronate monooxygenase
MSTNPPLNELLRVQFPILLAAMDLVADAKLTLAVSKAGGFGILGAGYGDANWLRRELAFLQEAQGSRSVPFGIGFITWRLAGQTEAMAKDAVMKGADIIVAQGAEAGGHGASRGAFSLVPAVVDAVGHKVPVVLAGGVADGRGLAAAIMLGAQGVALGTRFYACQESAGHEKAKARIVAASGDDTLRSIIFDISRHNVWPAPYAGRCLANDHSRKWVGREIELMRHLHEEADR